MALSPDALYADAKANNTMLLADARAALTDAKSAASVIGFSTPNWQNITVTTPPEVPGTPEVPTLPDVELDLPSEPGDVPTFQDIPSLDVGALPTAPTDAPTISLPNQPSQLTEVQLNLPTINIDAAFPTPPSALDAPLDAAPTLTARAAPDAPTVTIPTFEVQRPDALPAAPTDLEGTFSRALSGQASALTTSVNGYVDAQLTKINPEFHTQMSAVEAQLKKYAAGGTGLSAAVEAQIYERAKSRNNAEALKVRDTAIKDMAARGFTLPNGALLSAAQQARQAGADNNAKASVEIAVMQAEMEQKNLQFAVTTSVSLRTAVINASLSYMQNIVAIQGQALDYAKAMVSTTVEMYNTAVKAFSAKLELYKSEASVYEAKIRGAMASVELYKAEIQALEALTNVDRAKVDIYKARVDTLVSYANAYKAKVDAVVSKASLEKLKVDLYQAQVQAFGARIQAKNAEWQGYTAAIAGEEAKAKLFSTRVEAYSAQVNGYKATIEGKAEAVRAAATTNQARAAQYSAAVSAYGAIVRAKGDAARTKLENNRQLLVSYQAKVQAIVANAQLKLDYSKVSNSIAMANAEGNFKAQLGEIGSRKDYLEAVARLASSNASVYGSMTSSALAGMTSLAASTVTAST